ncbi:hypothetical protein [Pontibacter ummariensis]|uniref:hypothetical protein n=1 Tax=Pontibacter ummariensis TaxID=1610492 RepID=UPI0011867243|nr:hypothetical protein [Pontibacter ummariensis]
MLRLLLRRNLTLNKLNVPSIMAQNKLFTGEQYLTQTLDNRMVVTTHRLILKQAPWALRHNQSLLLDDITGWDVKATGHFLYLYLGIASAVTSFFIPSFSLLPLFFLALFLMTRHRRVYLKTASKEVLLPVEVDEACISSLLQMVRQVHPTTDPVPSPKGKMVVAA